MVESVKTVGISLLMKVSTLLVVIQSQSRGTVGLDDNNQPNPCDALHR